MDARGVDDTGKEYDTPQQLWEAVARQPGGNGSAAAAGGKKAKPPKAAAKGVEWYKTNVEYWDAQPPTDDGVLGGFGFVADVDIRDSAAFLQKALGPELKEAAAGKRQMVALDCGAGVGRVCEALLLHHFQEVDLVEPSAHLLVTAKKRLGGSGGARPFPRAHRAVNFFQTGLEAFDPEAGRYDALWIQWAMLYLTDEDASAFLRRCAAALRPGGAILIKENVCGEGFLVDTSDASVTRSHAYNVELFTKGTGLRLAHTALQRGYPKSLFKVRMYALKHAAATEHAEAAAGAAGAAGAGQEEDGTSKEKGEAASKEGAGGKGKRARAA